MGTESTAPA